MTMEKAGVIADTKTESLDVSLTHSAVASTFATSDDVFVVAPVLFLVFNRPDCTQIVFDRIRAAKPKQLFIACDGPRKNRSDDLENVAAVHAIIKNVDWDCDVQYLLRKDNLGCGKAVSGGITWFFEHVTQGIILEDDCVPDLSFFRFCTELLERYKDDTRIMNVNGRNVAGTWPTVDNTSYFFFQGLSIWGWATWRRAWNEFDLQMKDWPTVKQFSHLYPDFPHKSRLSAYEVCEQTYQGKIDTWDYQWSYAMEKNRGLTIVPSVNLVRNIGFGASATHTHIENPKMSKLLEQQMVFPLKHPIPVCNDKKYSDYFLRLGSVNWFKKVHLLLYNVRKHPAVILKRLRFNEEKS